MNFLGFIIGTAILWFLTAVFVKPLASSWTKKKLAREGIPLPEDPKQIEQMDEETKGRINSIFTRNYILADVLVLGIAGFLIGITTGSFFIGIALEGKGWPGMLVFIISSILGSAIHG